MNSNMDNNITPIYCLVSNCNFPYYHLSKGHQCGICGNYGHGQIECCNQKKMKDLNLCIDSITIPLNLQCKIANCRFAYLHTTQGHKCYSCNLFGHGTNTCPNRQRQSLIQSYKISCPSCRTENTIKKNQRLIIGLEEECIICCNNKVNVYLPACGHTNLCIECVKKIYDNTNNNYEVDPALLPEEFIQQNNNIEIPVPSQIIRELFEHHRWIYYNLYYDGTTENIIEISKNIFGNKENKIFACFYISMGCYIFVRRNAKDAEIETFMMHSDSWGQYGSQTSNVENLNQFVNEYELQKAN